MARSTRKKAEKQESSDSKREALITHGEVSADNPSGIEAVSEEHAQHLGTLVGYGGPGAAGATVAGPIVHVATEGGTKPLPVANLPEDVETSAGGDASDQETSQATALKSGDPKDTGDADASDEVATPKEPEQE